MRGNIPTQTKSVGFMLWNACLNAASGLLTRPAAKILNATQGFLDLLKDLVHAWRIVLQVHFAGHLGKLAAQQLAQFLGRAPPVVDAAGVEIDIPALFVDHGQHFGMWLPTPTIVTPKSRNFLQ